MDVVVGGGGSMHEGISASVILLLGVGVGTGLVQDGTSMGGVVVITNSGSSPLGVVHEGTSIVTGGLVT